MRHKQETLIQAQVKSTTLLIPEEPDYNKQLLFLNIDITGVKALVKILKRAFSIDQHQEFNHLDRELSVRYAIIDNKLRLFFVNPDSIMPYLDELNRIVNTYGLYDKAEGMAFNAKQHLDTVVEATKQLILDKDHLSKVVIDCSEDRALERLCKHIISIASNRK